MTESCNCDNFIKFIDFIINDSSKFSEIKQRFSINEVNKKCLQDGYNLLNKHNIQFAQHIDFNKDNIYCEYVNTRFIRNIKFYN